MRETRVLSILFTTLLLDVIGIGILIPVIPALFTDTNSPFFMLSGYGVGEQYFIVGLMTALFGVMQFVTAPLLGELSDVYGRKRLLLLGVGVLALAQVVFAIGITQGSLLLLLVSRLIAGIAGANYSIVQAAIADVTVPALRARNFGLIGAAFGLGFILGPLFGGWLVGGTGNPALPFMFAGGLGALNVLCIIFLLPETRQTASRFSGFSLFKAFRDIKVAYLDTAVRPLYTVSFLQMLGFSIYTSFSAVFLTYRFGFTESDSGTYFAIVGGWIIFAQLIVVRLAARRFSETSILMSALPLLALVLMAQVFVFNDVWLYVLLPFTAAAVGLISTNLPALISKGVGAESQGAALGINGSLQALANGLAPLLASAVAAVAGVPAIYVLASILVLVAFLVMYKKIVILSS